MWNGLVNDPPCITIFSAPNYCGHENPGTIFVTGTGLTSKVLTYGEAPYKPFYLPYQKLPDEPIEEYEIDYPIEPLDAFRWFMLPMREFITGFFNVVTAKINSQEEAESSSEYAKTLSATSPPAQDNNTSFEAFIN